ncbi:MAG: hypothetical protein ABI972_02160 [Acidobacteriota bacterium]
MRITALGFLLATILNGQASKDLLLPETRTIQCVVVEQDGTPVKDAEIGHTGIREVAGRSTSTNTDAQGRFQVTTSAPLIVIRKPRYASNFLRTRDTTSGGQHRLMLKPTKRTLPICSHTGRYESLEGWQAWFRFVPMSRIRVGKQGRDVDYGIRYYFVKTPKGNVGIVHGSGPVWSLGAPLDSVVWKSLTFEEESFEVDGFRILDSKGEWTDGTRWRTIGKLGETASYSEVGKETAKILDQFMDGACVAPF